MITWLFWELSICFLIVKLPEDFCGSPAPEDQMKENLLKAQEAHSLDCPYRSTTGDRVPTDAGLALPLTGRAADRSSCPAFLLPSAK